MNFMEEFQTDPPFWKNVADSWGHVDVCVFDIQGVSEKSVFL